MASAAITFSFFFLLPLFTFLATADDAATATVPPETICASTPHPSYCINLLPKQHARVHDFGKFSVQKSYLQSRKFSNTLNFYLRRRSNLSKGTIRAIEDCRFLSELSSEYLSRSNETLHNSDQLADDDAQTLLSAVITNHQTCYEGLTTTATDSTVKNALFGRISDDNKLHSVSLALFTKGCVQKKQNKTSSAWNHRGLQNGRLPLKMSNRTRDIYDSARGRGKQGNAYDQDDDGGILISDIVVVSQDGSGNFTTITEAVAAAPNNNTNGTSGYFLIYVREGVYEEYVSIPQSKAYLMMMGGGINRTVITGNRSVGDGWTTFNSPTFATWHLRLNPILGLLATQAFSQSLRPLRPSLPPPPRRRYSLPPTSIFATANTPSASALSSPPLPAPRSQSQSSDLISTTARVLSEPRRYASFTAFFAIAATPSSLSDSDVTLCLCQDAIRLRSPPLSSQSQRSDLSTLISLSANPPPLSVALHSQSQSSDLISYLSTPESSLSQSASALKTTHLRLC